MLKVTKETKAKENGVLNLKGELIINSLNLFNSLLGENLFNLLAKTVPRTRENIEREK